MSKIIEIIDSDDDNSTPPDAVSTSYKSSNNTETDDNQQSQSRRRRRKSALHAMTDPDMQFQTIAVEDDDDDETKNSSSSTPTNQKQKSRTNKTGAAAVRPQVKTLKTTPKILSGKIPSAASVVDTAFEQFLNNPETISDIYAIAEERARVNYLLTLNGLPEINFTLYASPDRLQSQLEERLKLRKAGQNPENRRSLLQQNSEQTGT